VVPVWPAQTQVPKCHLFIVLGTPASPNPFTPDKVQCKIKTNSSRAAVGDSALRYDCICDTPAAGLRLPRPATSTGCSCTNDRPAQHSTAQHSTASTQHGELAMHGCHRAHPEPSLRTLPGLADKGRGGNQDRCRKQSCHWDDASSQVGHHRLATRQMHKQVFVKTNKSCIQERRVMMGHGPVHVQGSAAQSLAARTSDAEHPEATVNKPARKQRQARGNNVHVRTQRRPPQSAFKGNVRNQANSW